MSLEDIIKRLKEVKEEEVMEEFTINVEEEII